MTNGSVELSLLGRNLSSLLPPIAPVPSPLAGVQIHLVDLPTTASAIDDQRLVLLDGPTIDRATAFKLPRHRAEFVAAHLAARWVVAQAQGLPFSEVVIRRRCRMCGSEEHGKPFVAAADQGTRVAFNLSHTSGAALVAVADPEIQGVGVDVEGRTATNRMHELGASILHPAESEPLATAGDNAAKADALLQMWVRKEAALKATGHGLAIPMNRLKVSRAQGSRMMVTIGSTPIQIGDLELSMTTVGAVAADLTA